MPKNGDVTLANERREEFMEGDFPEILSWGLVATSLILTVFLAIEIWSPR
ncbi:MAG: hypothetical protein H7834_01735 [Magnetococcus sp. YQC-9]